MRTSDAIDQIVPALVKAQGMIPPVHKSATNTFFNNKYAPLDAVMDAALAACQANDLFIMQGQVGGEFEGWYCTETTLLHGPSGQWVTGGEIWFPIAPDVRKDGTVMPRTPQNACAGSSYSRRYSVASILAIVPDTDDDGNSASGHIEAPVQRQSVKSSETPGAVRSPQVKASLDALAAGDKPSGIPKSCPNCGGKVWDNTAKKASGQFKPSSPDWSCADAVCKQLPGSVGWPDKKGGKEAGLAEMRAALGPRGSGPGLDQIPTVLDEPEEELPF